MLKELKNSKHEETLDDLNKEKVWWLPVVPRQQKHLAIAVLSPAQTHVEVTEGRIETCGVAVGLHQLSLDQDLPTKKCTYEQKKKKETRTVYLITLNTSDISMNTDYE